MDREDASKLTNRTSAQPRILQTADLYGMIDELHLSFDVVGPIVGNAAIMLDTFQSSQALAIGYGDSQSPGEYRLLPKNGHSRFSFGNGPDSPKKFLHPSRQILFEAEIDKSGFKLESPTPAKRPLAFFALRPCDIQAIHVLDQVFLTEHTDLLYSGRREGAFIVALNCTEPGGTCFCSSMGTGPAAERDYDLRMTELPEGMLTEAGTARGQELLHRHRGRSATRAEVEKARRQIAAAAFKMGRTLDTNHLPQILRDELENPVWDVMKDWCLGCANCTAVCPTCFCYSTTENIDLSFRKVVRERYWDLCFTWQFAEVHGCNFRGELRNRYRHWLCHKLGFWVEQYGMFGCVGCGRCLTWCPVKIDITEVATNIRRSRR